jgi:hypothetical protein
MALADRFNTCMKNAIVTSGGQVGERRRQAGPAEGTVSDKWARSYLISNRILNAEN